MESNSLVALIEPLKEYYFENNSHIERCIKR